MCEEGNKVTKHCFRCLLTVVKTGVVQPLQSKVDALEKI